MIKKGERNLNPFRFKYYLLHFVERWKTGQRIPVVKHLHFPFLVEIKISLLAENEEKIFYISKYLKTREIVIILKALLWNF